MPFVRTFPSFSETVQPGAFFKGLFLEQERLGYRGADREKG